MLRRLLLVSLLLGIALPCSAQEKVFRAGAFAQDITPTKFPISSNGGFQDRMAKRAHDRLHARCLVLDDGTNQLAIVVCDSCMIPRDITDEAKRLAKQATGLPPERIVISATHTHTAPTVAGVFQSDPDPDYVKALPGLIADGIAKAHAKLAPAKIGWGLGQDATQLFNRRWKVKPGSVLLTDPFGKGTDRVRMNPGHQHADLLEQAGPIDPGIAFLSVQSRDGRPVALFANYSLHYVGGLPELSADYFAIYAERVRALLKADADFVAAMSNGTSGDINNVNFAGAPFGKKEPGEQARVVAESVAQATLAAHRKVEHRDWLPLASAQAEVELGVRRPTEAEVARATEILANAKKPVLTTPTEVYARETILMAKYPPKVKAVVQAHRVGELGIVAIPCETFVEIGLEIKAKSPFKATFTQSLANGYHGYLPTPEQHALGGYETWRARSSYLEVDASRAITAKALELLKQVAK